MTPEGLDYPTEDELQKIRTWDWHDPHGLMAYVKERWHFADWGWTEEAWGWSDCPADEPAAASRASRKYRISTGGWSGNEDIIRAMQENAFFWTLCWWSSRRGGHYEFRVATAEDKP